MDTCDGVEMQLVWQLAHNLRRDDVVALCIRNMNLNKSYKHTVYLIKYYKMFKHIGFAIFLNFRYCDVELHINPYERTV